MLKNVDKKSGRQKKNNSKVLFVKVKMFWPTEKYVTIHNVIAMLILP